jgi:hypothetical protein
MHQGRSRCSALRVLLVAATLTFCLSECLAWSSNQKAFGSRQRNQPSVTHQPTSVEAPKSSTSQKMLPNKSGNPLVKNTRKVRESKSKLSHSVLASCDTLPSFPTAHGLLSPETVMRLEEMKNGSKEVQRFLSTYRSHGPLSCVSMLSDPEILPHLTRAMREITM